MTQLTLTRNPCSRARFKRHRSLVGKLVGASRTGSPLGGLEVRGVHILATTAVPPIPRRKRLRLEIAIDSMRNGKPSLLELSQILSSLPDSQSDRYTQILIRIQDAFVSQSRGQYTKAFQALRAVWLSIERCGNDEHPRHHGEVNDAKTDSICSEREGPLSQSNIFRCIETVQRVHDEQIDSLERQVAKVRQAVRMNSNLGNVGKLTSCKKEIRHCLDDQNWLRIFCFVSRDVLQRIAAAQGKSQHQHADGDFLLIQLHQKRFMQDSQCTKLPGVAGPCQEIKARAEELDNEIATLLASNGIWRWLTAGGLVGLGS